MKLFILLLSFSFLIQCGGKTRVGIIPVGQFPDSHTRYFPDDEEELDVLAIDKSAKEMCIKRGLSDFLGYEIDNISRSKWAELPFTGSPKYRNLNVWCKK